MLPLAVASLVVVPAAETSDVAETIFAAATDDAERLRYPSGNDARMFIDMRREQDDETFARSLKRMFNM